MITQLAFSDDTIQARFDAFHEANPIVFVTLERETQRWLDAGHSRLGVKFLWERVRWVLSVDVKDAPVPKFNNNFTSRYVRLLIDRHPEWADVFETRIIRSA